MAEVLKVQLRETRGKRNARRLRQAGSIPAVLYGHGEQSIAISVPAEEFDTAIRHGSRVVDLVGGITQHAFVRELQWDTWGLNILHVDFTRISEHEKIEIEVVLELRGEAPGIKEGGIVDHVLHRIQIECEATAIPEKVQVNINQLALGQSITAAELELPDGINLLTNEDALVVQCVEPMEEAEEVEGEAAEVEPEVIGRKKEDEEE